MGTGTLYGIGVGPGDPELVTVKAAGILARIEHVFVPRARRAPQSVAWGIAGTHVNPAAQVHEVIFPMSSDPVELEAQWHESTRDLAAVLQSGSDAAYLTLGDTMFYSTYGYMLMALRRRVPQVEVVTVPGITSFSAAAAVAEFPLGEGPNWVTIVPAAQELSEISTAVSRGGTVVLMKIGNRLPAVLDLLEDLGMLDKSVFVSRVGLDHQRVETDLRKLRDEATEDTGNLSVVLVRTGDAGAVGR